jgi:hypothetical protein
MGLWSEVARTRPESGKVQVDKFGRLCADTPAWASNSQIQTNLPFCNIVAKKRPLV